MLRAQPLHRAAQRAHGDNPARDPFAQCISGAANKQMRCLLAVLSLVCGARPNLYRVKVVCLSFGERGESAKLWRRGPDMTIEKVKAARREEALAAARILGAECEFFDLGDYPLRFG